MEPKYRTKGFLARSLALYYAARLGTRVTARKGDGAIRAVESISAVRRAQPISARSLDDSDFNALA